MPVMSRENGAVRLNCTEACWPGVNTLGNTKATIPGIEATGVVSVEVLFAGFRSSAVLTVTMLLTAVNADSATATVKVIEGAEPAARAKGRVQVTICPVVEHAQLTPEAETKVIPDGRVSVTVIALDEATVPALLTVSE